MCRIAGLVTNLPAAEAKAQVSAMAMSMAHESFYTCSIHAMPTIGGYFGWVDARRPGNRTPVVQHHGRKTLIFAGEHFGDSTGSPSQPQYGVNAATLISAYERQGDRCLRELNGWFAGAIIDAERGEVLIFNDRFGLHRLYYTEAPGGFAFASEAKAILAVRPDLSEIDPAGLGQLLAVGSVFDDKSLFRNISRMPGGSAWTLRAGCAVAKRIYFCPSELESQAPLGDMEFYDQFGDALARVVPKYFAGNDPAAVSLTGGFDSRAILAFGRHASTSRLAYTYNGMYRDCCDVQVARRVADACGYRHDVVQIDHEFLASFPDSAEKTVWTTDGTLDITAAHEVYLSRRARSIAPVRVTGNYGGEVFRRVSTFKPTGLSRAIVAPEFLPHVDEALEAFTALKKRHPVSFAVFDEIPSNFYGRLSAAQSQLTVRTPYMDNALVSLAYRVPKLLGNTTAGWTRVICKYAPDLAAIPTDRGKLGSARATAAAERLYGYAMFKGEWYYDAGMPAWLSRIDRASAGATPPFFVGSHKIQHYRLWFRDHVSGYLQELLDGASRSRPYLNGERCRNLVAEHRSGVRNNVSEISAVATIELVNRVLLEQRHRTYCPQPVEELVS
jgi:asparagine synthase (glutamine-hydrolysing)